MHMNELKNNLSTRLGVCLSNCNKVKFLNSFWLVNSYDSDDRTFINNLSLLFVSSDENKINSIKRHFDGLYNLFMNNLMNYSDTSFLEDFLFEFIHTIKRCKVIIHLEACESFIKNVKDDSKKIKLNKNNEYFNNYYLSDVVMSNEVIDKVDEMINSIFDVDGKIKNSFEYNMTDM